GRPENPVNHEYIKLGVRDKNGHVAMNCKYYQEVTQRGRSSEMKSHLALECNNVPGNIKKIYLHIITDSNPSKKKKKIEIETNNQPKITDKFQSTHIDQSQEKLINKALTHFFTCCGIPFWPPDRRTLSNLWVDQETARITINTDEQFKRLNNLTL
ncbi:13196_t:CDS:2, partial [Gigaspora rosea]